MNAPPIIWIDERIASNLPQAKDEELAERGVEQVRYIAQSRVNDLVEAARGGDEFICQIAVDNDGQMIFGLSNLGRLWIFMKPSEHIGGEWVLLADRELQVIERADISP